MNGGIPMSLIQKEIADFSVQCYQNNAFRTATKADVLGKWSVFFFYPAGEALMGSFYMEDSFGLSKEFVGLDNFTTLFSDPSYLETLRLTLVFSLATIVLTMGTALLFAVLADQVNWGGTLYKSMLIIPYRRSRACSGCSCSTLPGACSPSCSTTSGIRGTTRSTAIRRCSC